MIWLKLKVQKVHVAMKTLTSEHAKKNLLEDHRYAFLGTTLQNLALPYFLAMGEVKDPSTIP